MKLFSPFSELQIAYSKRQDGSFRDPQLIKNFLKSEISAPLSYLKLEHGHQILSVSKSNDEVFPGDSIITNLKNQILSLVVADCFPVIIFDPQNHALALLHCGWKSLSQNLIALSLEQMHNTYQTQAKDVWVWVGPGICPDHYQQKEKPDQLGLENWQSSINIIEYKTYSINLAQFIKEELIRVGIKTDRIQNENLCTYERGNSFFSHRRATKENDEDGRFFVAVWQS